VGFHIDRGAVLNDYILLRRGGYYIDVETLARIVSRDIKVKSRVTVKRFIEKDLEL
jgi:hypothetical protein